MRLPARQLLLTLGLLGPLAAAAATTPPFEARAGAQNGRRMVGPLFPVRVDSNNNGLPDAGDEAVSTTLAGNQLTVNSRWKCNPTSTNNVLTFSAPDSAGRFRTVSRVNDKLTQSVTAAGSGASATQFNWTQVSPTSTKTGIANLVDINGDGVIDQLMISGSSVSAAVSFAYTPNSQDISIPWAQASALGVKTGDTCGGTDPQIWIPVADTNGDGVGDTIVPDLDGNGAADPQFLPSPPVAAPAVPSMGVYARILLTLLLGVTAIRFLSRRSAGPASA